MSRLVRLIMAIVPKLKALLNLGEPSQLDAVFMPIPQHEVHENKTSCSSPSSSSDRSASPAEEVSRPQYKYFLKLSIIAVCVATLTFIAVMVCKDYLKVMLVWMENINHWVAAMIFAVLFTLVSFPMMWGYVVLNVAAGYLYGLTMGSVLVIICAFIGVSVGHELTRRFLNEYVIAKISTGLGNESLRAILRVVEGGRGFKVVALARLTPIPFGLQNGIFAVSVLLMVY